MEYSEKKKQMLRSDLIYGQSEDHLIVIPLRYHRSLNATGRSTIIRLEKNLRFFTSVKFEHIFFNLSAEKFGRNREVTLIVL